MKNFMQLNDHTSQYKFKKFKKSITLQKNKKSRPSVFWDLHTTLFPLFEKNQSVAMYFL